MQAYYRPGIASPDAPILDVIRCACPAGGGCLVHGRPCAEATGECLAARSHTDVAAVSAIYCAAGEACDAVAGVIEALVSVKGLDTSQKPSQLRSTGWHFRVCSVTS